MADKFTLEVINCGDGLRPSSNKEKKHSFLNKFHTRKKQKNKKQKRKCQEKGKQKLSLNASGIGTIFHIIVLFYFKFILVYLLWVSVSTFSGNSSGF